MGKTPKSETKKSNTLFNYFSKTPIDKNCAKKPDEQSKVSNTDKSARKLNFPQPDVGYKAGDVTWVKMEGHPWWPALVCLHPKEKKIWRKKNGYMIHVQFIENPPSRGWIKHKLMKAYKGSEDSECQRGGTYHTLDPKWKESLLEADALLQMSVEERLEKVTVVDSSDDEAAMDVDEDSSNSNEKENKEPDVKATKRRRIIESDDEDVHNSSLDESFQPNEDEDDDDESDEEEEEEEEEEDDSDAGSSSSSPKGLKRRRNEKTNKSLKKLKKQREAKKNRQEDENDKDVVSEGGDDGIGGGGDDGIGNVQIKMAGLSAKKRLSSFTANPTEDKAPPALSCPSTPKQPPLSDPSTPKQLPPSTPKQLPPSTPKQPQTPSFPSDTPTYQHTTFKFLFPENITDAQGRRPDHPDYDTRSLKLPSDFLAKQTPAMKQWWILKSKHFDTILFFKMGKFYELFHMDAVVGVNELNILYMKGDYAHCGFPEISYGRFSELLVAKGYKVARVEQTETPDQMQERCKIGKLPSKEKVVRREICSIQSRGTKRSSFIDGECNISHNNNFLLAICEEDSGSNSVFGVCFVDVMIGTFHIGQFVDDRHGSRLRTLVSHYTPVQVLYRKGKLSDKCKLMFDGCLHHVQKEALKCGTEFWEADKTVKYLADVYNKEEQWPQALEAFVDFEPLASAKPTASQALSALGAVIWYLKHCLMEHELLSIKSFEEYKPLDHNYTSRDEGVTEDEEEEEVVVFKSSHMVLDGVTLVNLDVLLNSSTGTEEGSLLSTINSCKTPFGKRLFKQWLCSPLCSVASINDRLDAIEDLSGCADVVKQAYNLMNKLPDLDRLLNKIHTMGSSRHNPNHPDSRAVFFEDVIYSKRKIEDFISTLHGFKNVLEIINLFSSICPTFKSKVLKGCVTQQNEGGHFPDINDTIDFFNKSFDQQKARSEGVIKPKEGVNPDYDAAMTLMLESQTALDQYLDDFKKKLNCKTLQYIGTGRNRFQMEVPESVAKKIPDSFELTSQRKGFKRYQDDNIKEMFGRLCGAEDQRDAAQRDTMKCLFDQFDRHFKEWTSATQCISVLDCLMCLSHYSSSNNTCRPQFVQQKEPLLEIRNGRHPCIAGSMPSFIPNDTLLGLQAENSGTAAPKCMLLTGANMGGKSTLMRQDALICIMAHLGCHVPADVCRLTPIDRIFTRLGASDHIMTGESSFYVELSETWCILQHATKHSLVLLDELGRGTGTYDGNAIASAVLEHLVQHIACRSLFSTHYHSIVQRFTSNPLVSLAHMACMAENEGDPTLETITFLYKLAPGSCPKSHGFNAAKLAGIPLQVIKDAHKKAKEFEESVKDVELFRYLCQLEEKDAPMLSSVPPHQWYSLLAA